MDSTVFMKGMIIGFTICAPCGPIGLLCLRKSILDGRLAGAISVLGASTVDGIYCALAGLGITWIANIMIKEKILIQVLGSIILMLIGALIYSMRNKHSGDSKKSRGLVGAFSSTFILMLGHPFPIVLFTATFAALGVPGWKADGASTALLVLGVFGGSILWAPIFAFVGSLFPAKIGALRMKVVNKTSGFVIFGIGLGLCVTSMIQ
jgi:threonine/homoserine/homoserine lactone efflux protein